MSISAQQVQKLREMTGAGILDCKSALESCTGDYDKAMQFLREKGKASAAKKLGRSASEGLVSVWIDSTQSKGSIVELNCETDFVARTEEFQSFIKTLAKTSGEKDVQSLDALKSSSFNGSAETVETIVKEKIGKLGENILLKKAAVFGGEKNSYVGYYIHSPEQNAPECGKLGVLVEFKSEKKSSELDQISKEISMQIAATSPRWIKNEDIPQEIIESEKKIYLEQCKQAGKPEIAWPKIIDGKLKDFFKQFCLLDQPHVRDSSGKTSIQSLLQTLSEKQGLVEVCRFVRFKVGEE